MLRFGYNTNGFAHHRLDDAIGLLAELGYRAVAITLDHFALNPFDRDLKKQMGAIRTILERHTLSSVVETGTRFLLDSRRKHQPTMLSPETWQREYRLEFLRRAIWIADSLGSDCVSFWSGTPDDDAPESEHNRRLIDGCRSLAAVAAERKVRLAFEPEPGMLVDTMEKYSHLHDAVNSEWFGLTLDIGHLHCMGEPIVETIHRWQSKLWNVHIEDMRRGVHQHLMFGDGEIEFPPVLNALKGIAYSGGVHVELSRHSHDAVNTARAALAFLRAN